MKRVLVGFLATALMAAVSVASAETTRLSIATGGTGGVYYPMGGGMAAVLSKYVPGMQATAEVTGGSVDNLKLIGAASPTSASRWPTRPGTPYSGQDKFKGQQGRRCAR